MQTSSLKKAIYERTEMKLEEDKENRLKGSQIEFAHYLITGIWKL